MKKPEIALTLIGQMDHRFNRRVGRLSDRLRGTSNRAPGPQDSSLPIRRQVIFRRELQMQVAAPRYAKVGRSRRLRS